jgi:hypothetical protein
MGRCGQKWRGVRTAHSANRAHRAQGECESSGQSESGKTEHGTPKTSCAYFISESSHMIFITKMVTKQLGRSRKGNAKCQHALQAAYHQRQGLYDITTIGRFAGGVESSQKGTMHKRGAKGRRAQLGMFDEVT